MTNSPLMTNTLELRFVFRIRLDAQTGREDELAYCCAEAGEEGVEGLEVAQGGLALFIHSI